MQNHEWYLADLKSTGKNTIETVEKSLTDMFIRLVRIYPCLLGSSDRGDNLIISQEKVTCGMTQSSCIEPSHNRVAYIMLGL